MTRGDAPPGVDSREQGTTAERVVAALLLVLGVALRLWGISDHELWIDEYGTWWVVAGESWAESFARAWSVQGQSPLFYLLTRASVELFGAGTFALRLPGLVFGVALLSIARPLGRAIFRDSRAALGTLAVIAVSGPLIGFSQDARPYSLALFGAALSTYGLAKWSRSSSRRAGLAWVIGTLLTWYGHYLFAPLVLAQGLWLLWQLRSRADLRRPALRLILLQGIMMAPGLLQLRALMARRGELDWVPEGEGFLAELVDVLGMLFPPGATVAAGVIALFLALRFGLRPLWRPRTARLAAVWVLIPIAVCVSLPLVLGINLLHLRYCSVVLPGAALVLGALLALCRSPRILGLLPIAVWLGFATFGWLLPAYERCELFSYRFTDQRWAEATACIARDWEEGDLILHRTAFIELDAIARGEGSELIRDFVDWPIRAHLPAERYELQRLPHSEATFEEVGWTLDRIPPGRRVWMIGRGEDVLRCVEAMIAEDPRLEILRRERFGVIELRLITWPAR